MTLLLGLTACMEDISLDHLRPEPKLVLNSLPTSGEPIKAAVSHTWFYTDPEPDMRQKEVEIKLYVDDQFIENLQWAEKEDNNPLLRHYRGTYIPKEGDQIRLKATATGFKPAEATTRLPSKPEISAFWCENKNDTVFENGYIHVYLRSVYHLTLQDPPGQKDYYMMYIQKKADSDGSEEDQDENNWKKAYLDYNSDPVFSSQLTPFDKILGYDWVEGYGRAFTDDLFDGTSYTFSINSWTGSNRPRTDGTDPGANYRLVFYRLSPEYYLYLHSIQGQRDNLMADLINAGLAEPIRIYSNVKGGIGIVGGCSVTMKEI